MAGHNLFKSATVVGSTEMCVFISHNSKDKPMARAVANAIKAMDIDIYFDENDELLQAAASIGNDTAIVRCIEDGLNKATHLLGLITRQTFSSWWVPYEIGGAHGRHKTCGHLVASDVDRLPSYIKIASVLSDTQQLSGWLVSQENDLTGMLKKAVLNRTAQSYLGKYVPAERNLAEIGFY